MPSASFTRPPLPLWWPAWVKLDELTDDYAIFKDWPTEQDRIAVTHLMEMPDLKWEKEVDGKYYMSREQYDTGNEQL